VDRVCQLENQYERKQRAECAVFAKNMSLSPFSLPVCLPFHILHAHSMAFSTLILSHTHTSINPRVYTFCSFLITQLIICHKCNANNMSNNRRRHMHERNCERQEARDYTHKHTYTLEHLLLKYLSSTTAHNHHHHHKYNNNNRMRIGSAHLNNFIRPIEVEGYTL